MKEEVNYLNHNHSCTKLWAFHGDSWKVLVNSVKNSLVNSLEGASSAKNRLL